MKPALPIVANVRRILQHYGLAESVALDTGRTESDRVFAWPNGDALMVHCVLNRWPEDAERVVEHHHGDGAVAFREPNARPALQVIFHPNPDRAAHPSLYFIELDVDRAAPTSLRGTIEHSGEVIVNAITRRKTDQGEIAAMLDDRFKVA